MDAVYEIQSGDRELLESMDAIKLMIMETYYVGGRMQQGTMTPDEAKEWLNAHGHGTPQAMTDPAE